MIPWFRFLLCACSCAAAADSLAVDAFIHSALERRLDTNRTWLSLGRWSRDGSGWRSGIDGGYFFLSPKGSGDPKSELVATIRALSTESDISPYAKDTTPLAMHPRTKYRARTRFLLESGMPDSLLAPADTGRWLRWSAGVRPTRATLVYASSYLGNPASMFGHVLLRFDAGDREGLRDRLNYGITYGAGMPPGDALYAIKGLFGFYPGFITILPYYMSLQKYKYLESRDLWEYPLALDSLQTQKLLEIVWESGASWNRYYFLTRNCATGLAQLLDVLLPDSAWSASFPSPSMPPEFVRLVRERGFAGAPVRRPSQLALFVERRDRLTETELDRLDGLLRNDPSDSSASDSASSARVLDAAIDYAGWKRRNSPNDTIWKGRFERLLSRRAAIRIAPEEIDGSNPSFLPPEAGHRPRLLGVWGWTGSDKATGIGMTARLAYHALEERPKGYLDGSEVEAGLVDAAIRLDDTPSFRLRRLEILRIRSVPLWDGWLKPWAWQLRMSARPFGLEATPWANFEIGKGIAFGTKSVRAWAMASARAALAPWEGIENAAVGPQALAGALLASNRASLGLEAGWFEGWPTRKHEAVLDAVLRLSATREFDLDFRARATSTGDFQARTGCALHL